MNQMQILTLLAVFVLLVAAAPATRPAQQDSVNSTMRLGGVTMSIEMPAHAPLGAPLKLRIRLTNESGEDVYCAGSEPAFTSVIVQEANGRDVQITEAGLKACPNGDGGTMLRPGDAVVREIDLTEWFQFPGPGGYRVSANRNFVAFMNSGRTRGLATSVLFGVDHAFDLQRD